MWESTPINSLCSHVTSGGTPRRDDPSNYTPSEVPWIKTGELNDGDIWTAEEFISRSGLEKSSAKMLPTGTVLMAMYGATVGALGRLAVPATCNQASCAMVVNPQAADSRWLLYSLMRHRSRIMDLANGAAQQNLNAQTIKNFVLPTPPLPEQQAIAEVLGALDDKVAANRALISTADELVRTRYERLPESDMSIGDIANQVRSQVTPDDPGLVYVGLEHVPRRLMWLTESGDSGRVTSAKAEFQKGDVLFGKLRPYFHKVVSAPTDGIASTDILVLRSIDPRLSGLLLAAASSDPVIAEVTASSAGTKMPRSNWADLSACAIRFGTASENLDFSAGVNGLRDAAEAALQESATLATLRDTLLPALMDGTLRVKDAEKTVSEAI